MISETTYTNTDTNQTMSLCPYRLPCGICSKLEKLCPKYGEYQISWTSSDYAHAPLDTAKVSYINNEVTK